MSRRVPSVVRHKWKLTDRAKRIFTCAYCSSWTGNVHLYLRDVCPARDRRVGERRREYEPVS